MAINEDDLDKVVHGKLLADIFGYSERTGNRKIKKVKEILKNLGVSDVDITLRMFIKYRNIEL